MELIIAALVAMFFLSKSNAASPAVGIPTGHVAPDTTSGAPAIASSSSTPVIKQSVGTSLSAALGNQSRPPGHYSTGNPGSGAGVPSSTVQFYNPKTVFQIPASPSNPGTKMLPTQLHPTQHAPAKPTYIAARPSVGSRMPVRSSLVNPTQVNRYVKAPETQGTFWTQARIQVAIEKKR